ALAAHVVGTPGAVAGQLEQPWNVLGAVDVRLLDVHGHPAFGAPAGYRVERQVTVRRPHRRVVDDLRVPVDVQADHVPEKIYEEDADVGVLGDVAEARHHAVSPVLGPGEPPGVEYAHEARWAGPERAVAVAP